MGNPEHATTNMPRRVQPDKNEDYPQIRTSVTIVPVLGMVVHRVPRGRRLRWCVLGAAVLAVGLCYASAASAQERRFDLQLWQPPAAGGSTFTIDRTSVPRHLNAVFGIGISYANQPFTRFESTAADGTVLLEQQAVVAHLAQIEAYAALGLFEFVELGLAFPVGILEAASGAADDPTARTFAYDTHVGLADLRLSAKVPLLRGDFSLAARLVTQLPTGDPSAGHAWFRNWRAEMLAKESFPQGEMVSSGVVRKLMQAEIDAYDAPYPEEQYKSGPRRFPMILPIDLDNPARPANLAAWEKLASWEKPVLTLFAENFLGSSMGPDKLLEHIPGCAGQPHAGIPNTNFYIIEDAAPELARRSLDFISH